jgi:YVTN family beta-propeller protein
MVRTNILNLCLFTGLLSIAPITIAAISPVIQGTVTNPNFAGPNAIAITPDGTTAYVVNPTGGSGDGSISIVDVATNTVTGTVLDPMNRLDNPNFIAIQPVYGSVAYIINHGTSDTISILDIASNTIIDDIGCSIMAQECPTAIYDFRDPSALVFSPDGLLAYVISAPSTSSYINTITVSSGNIMVDKEEFSNYSPISNPYSVTITPNGDFLYISGNFDTVYIFDLTMNSIQTVSVTGSGAISMAPDGSKAYVADLTGVSIINTTSHVVTTVSGTTGSPTSITFSDDGTTAYLVNAGTNSISIVDVATDTVTGSILDPLNTLNQPTALAIASNRFKGFITNAGATAPGSVSVVGAFSPPPASSVKGSKTQNRLFLQTDFINVISWAAPTSGTAPATYNIYRDPSLTQLVAIIPGTGPLEYYDHNRNPNLTYSYYIVAVHENGNISAPISITFF